MAYDEPSLLQSTRWALGATALTGSCWSIESPRIVSMSSVGLGASSSCARTAIRRASWRVSRWIPVTGRP